MMETTSAEPIAIFLDCDGVLNSDWHGSKSTGDQGVIDREMVQSLGKLVRELEGRGLAVKIVVSSTWRRSSMLMGVLDAALAAQKLERFSKCPDLRERLVAERLDESQRRMHNSHHLLSIAGSLTVLRSDAWARFVPGSPQRSLFVQEVHLFSSY